jgi:hypothetical protein
VKRREFIVVLGGAATFTPPSAWAQQSQPPLIGVLNAAFRRVNDARSWRQTVGNMLAGSLSAPTTDIGPVRKRISVRHLIG